MFLKNYLIVRGTFLVLFNIFLVSSISSETITERGPSWETITEGNKISHTEYSTQVFMLDNNQTYRKFNNLISLSYSNYLLHMEHGSTFVSFEPYVLWNGSRYTLEQIINRFPSALQNVKINRGEFNYKFGLNISNIPQKFEDNLTDIGFRVVDSNNISIDEIIKLNDSLIIKGKYVWNFSDLIISGFDVSLNRTDFLVSNVSSHIINGSLWLDPSIDLNKTEGSNTLICTVINSSPTTSNCASGLAGLSSDPTTSRAYTKFNLSRLIHVSSIDYAAFFLLENFPLTQSSTSPVLTESIELHNCSDDSWTAPTWNVQGNDSCGVLDSQDIPFDGTLQKINWSASVDWILNEFRNDQLVSFLVKHGNESTVVQGAGNSTVFDVDSVSWLTINYTYADPGISVSVNPTSPYESDNNGLICNFTITAGGNITVNVTWWNETAQFTGQDNNTILVFNGVEYNSALDNAYIGVDENWSCQVTAWINDTSPLNLNITNSSAVTIDEYPNIILTSPNNTENVTTTDITFQYTPSDNSGLNNCSLWTNVTGAWSLRKTETSITNNASNSINLGTDTYVDGQSYNWSVECCDDNIGCNSSENYTFLVALTTTTAPAEAPAGGGGGGLRGVTTTILTPYPWRIEPRVIDPELGDIPAPLTLTGLLDTESYRIVNYRENSMTLTIRTSGLTYDFPNNRRKNSGEFIKTIPSGTFMLPGNEEVGFTIISKLPVDAIGNYTAEIYVTGVDYEERLQVTMVSDKVELEWWQTVIEIAGFGFQIFQWLVLASVLIAANLIIKRLIPKREPTSY